MGVRGDPAVKTDLFLFGARFLYKTYDASGGIEVKNRQKLYNLIVLWKPPKVNRHAAPL